MNEWKEKPLKQDAPASKSAVHWRTVAPLLLVISIMGGVVIYSPELYNMFCKATGYGGTTQRVDVSSDVILDKMITVRFDGTVARELGWYFKPMQRSIRVRIGETVVVKFKAKNQRARPVTGTAVYNVTPEIAGSYFNKIECFCFTEQKLAPGEEVEMPVSFYIDPDIINDKSGRSLDEITLSYVFYNKETPIKAAAVKQ